MNYYAIIVAGGTGSRMNSELPKQFLPINGRPVMMHAIEAFHQSDYRPQIILVLNSSYFDYWRELCALHQFHIPCTLVANGPNRFDSVKNGLKEIPQNSVVAVHDAVRPFVTNELITRCFKLAQNHAAVIPAVTSRDSVRKKEGLTTTAIPRENILLVQTPQVFPQAVLHRAYQQPYQENFTDDASVVELAGEAIFVTQGEHKNIKITYPEDLMLAELYLRK